MAIITAGYNGTLDEIQMADLLPRYSVVGADDFKATTQAGDRIVAISDGTALGPGTVDVATDLAPIQFDAASGTRYDLVALRRDWQPAGGGTSNIVIIKGGSALGFPDVGTATTQWNRRPGIVDDQPLYLQRIDGTLLGPRIDIRCWEAYGGMVARDELCKVYLDRPGTELYIDGVKWMYVLGLNDVPEWVVQGGTTVKLAPLSVTNWATTGAVSLTSEGEQTRVTVDLAFKRTGPDAGLTNTGLVPLSTPIPAIARGGSVTKYVPVWLSGGGNNIMIGATLNTSTGLVSVEAMLDPITIKTNAQFTLNLSYYID